MRNPVILQRRIAPRVSLQEKVVALGCFYRRECSADEMIASTLRKHGWPRPVRFPSQTLQQWRRQVRDAIDDGDQEILDLAREHGLIVEEPAHDD